VAPLGSIRCHGTDGSQAQVASSRDSTTINAVLWTLTVTECYKEQSRSEGLWYQGAGLPSCYSFGGFMTGCKITWDLANEIPFRNREKNESCVI
jgi:hypothetical protein